MPLINTLPAYKPHTLRVMFKCSGCKAACPVNAVEVSFNVHRDGPGGMYGHKVRCYALVDAPSSWSPSARSLAATNAHGVAAPYLHMERCGACGAKHGEEDAAGRTVYITGDVMRCKLKPDHKCDPRCTGAKGHNCECACNGANHGADNRAAFT